MEYLYAAGHYLRDINLPSIALRIAMALLVGGILGMERGRKHRPAGFRTYMLVCLGSALVMMTNQYVYEYFGGSDPVRMGAQVVSGIGFLGAGTIIITGKSQVKGITTAAGLWTAACSGLAIGIGFYEGAILGGATVFFIMSALTRLDDAIHAKSSIIDFYLEMDENVPLSAFMEHARSQGFDITDIQMKSGKQSKNGRTCAIMTAKSQTRRDHVEMMEILSEAEGTAFLEELRD